MQSEIIQEIIASSGGIRPLARLLTDSGKKTSPAHIQYWVKKGKISPSWVPHLSVVTGLPKERLDPYQGSSHLIAAATPVMSVRLIGELNLAMCKYELPSLCLRVVAVLISHASLKDWAVPITVNDIITRMGNEVTVSTQNIVRKHLTLLAQFGIASQFPSVEGMRSNLYNINEDVNGWSEQIASEGMTDITDVNAWSQDSITQEDISDSQEDIIVWNDESHVVQKNIDTWNSENGAIHRDNESQAEDNITEDDINSWSKTLG